MRASKESRPGAARQLQLWIKHSLLPKGGNAFHENQRGPVSTRTSRSDKNGVENDRNVTHRQQTRRLPSAREVSSVDEALDAFSGYRHEFPILENVVAATAAAAYDEDWILDGYPEWHQQYEKSQRLLRELRGGIGDVDDAAFLLELGSRVGLQEFQFAAFPTLEADDVPTTDTSTTGDGNNKDSDQDTSNQLQTSLSEFATHTIHPCNSTDSSDFGDFQEATQSEALVSTSSNALVKDAALSGDNSVPLVTIEERPRPWPDHETEDPSVLSSQSPLAPPHKGMESSDQVEDVFNQECYAKNGEGGAVDGVLDQDPFPIVDDSTLGSKRSSTAPSITKIFTHSSEENEIMTSQTIHHTPSSDKAIERSHPQVPSSPTGSPCSIKQAFTPRSAMYNYTTPSKTEPITPITNNYSQPKPPKSSQRQPNRAGSPSHILVSDEKKQQDNSCHRNHIDIPKDAEMDGDLASLATLDEYSAGSVPSVVQLFTQKAPVHRRSIVVPSTVRLTAVNTPQPQTNNIPEPSPFTPSSSNQFNQSLQRPLGLTLQLDRQSSGVSNSANSLATPEGRFARRASQIRKIMQGEDDSDNDSSCTDNDSFTDTASLGSLRSVLPDGHLWKSSQPIPSQEVLNQAISDMLKGLEWDWIPYWKLDHLLQEDCDPSYVPLWMEQITQQLSTLDAMHLRISKKLHKLIQPHAKELEEANRGALDLSKNLQLCQLYLDRSKQSIHQAMYASQGQPNMNSFDGVHGAQQLLHCWDTRDSYSGLKKILNQICRLREREQEILLRIEDYDIRMENSLDECTVIMKDTEQLISDLGSPSMSRLECLRQLRERANLLRPKVLVARLHDWLQSTTIRCCHTYMFGGFESGEYQRLLEACLLVELPEVTTEAFSQSFCTTIHTSLLLEAQKSFGMSLLNPTNSENEESDYDKELLALSTKAYLDPSKMSIWTHNLVTIRFDFELAKNHLPAIYHKLCSLLTNVLHGHHCLLGWHEKNRFRDAGRSSAVMIAVFEELAARRASVWNTCVKVLEDCLEEYLKFASKKTLFRLMEDGTLNDSVWLHDLIGLEDILGLTDQFLSLRKEFLEGVLEQGVNDGSMLREKLYNVHKKHLRAVHVEAMNTTGLSLYKETWACTPLPKLECSTKGTIDTIQQFMFTELTKMRDRDKLMESFSKTNQFACSELEAKYLSMFTDRGNPFTETPTKDLSPQISPRSLDTLTEFKADAKISALIESYLGKSSLNSPLLLASFIRSLLPWFARLLLVLEKLPPISEDVVDVVNIVSDLYLTTVFRISCGSSKHEKILLGIESPKVAIPLESITAGRAQSSTSIFGFGRRSPSNAIASTVSGLSSTLPPTADAEICSPLPSESEDVKLVAALILEAQEKLKGVAKLDLVDNWIVDANPAASQNLADLACQSARVLERRQASLWGCAFLALVFDISVAIAKEVFSGEKYGLSLSGMEKYFMRLAAAVPKLIELANRISCLRAIRGRVIVQQILLVGHGWEESKLHEHPNQYVDSVCDFMALLWCSLHNAKKIPLGAMEQIWGYVVEGGFASLLDGFSRIPYCSTEGRALMSMDLASFSSSTRSSEVRRRLKGHTVSHDPPNVSSIRGMSYVDTYIKVFYYPPMDALNWIRENFANYRMNHMVALIIGSAMATSENRKESIQKLMDTVIGYYSTNCT